MKFFSFIPIEGIIFGIVSLLLFILLLRRIRRREGGLFIYMANIIGIILFGLLSSTFLLLYSSFKNYHNFTYKKTIASIVCPMKESDWFVLKLIPENGEEKNSRFYRLKGQQFIIEGHIVKWKDFFISLGMKPLYQVNRLSGRYTLVEDEKQKERSVYELEKESKFWRFMMRHGKLIPGVDAVYGTASFTNPRENDTLELEITNYGFMLQ